MAKLISSRPMLAAIALIAITTPFSFMDHQAQAEPGVEPQAIAVKRQPYRGTAKDLGAVITPSDELLQKAPCYLEEIDAPDGSSVIVSPCSTGGQIGINPGLIEQFKVQGQIEKRDFEEQDKVRVDLFQF